LQKTSAEAEQGVALPDWLAGYLEPVKVVSERQSFMDGKLDGTVLVYSGVFAGDFVELKSALELGDLGDSLVGYSHETLEYAFIYSPRENAARETAIYTPELVNLLAARMYPANAVAGAFRAAQDGRLRVNTDTPAGTMELRYLRSEALPLNGEIVLTLDTQREVVVALTVEQTRPDGSVSQTRTTYDGFVPGAPGRPDWATLAVSKRVGSAPAPVRRGALYVGEREARSTIRDVSAWEGPLPELKAVPPETVITNLDTGEVRTAGGEVLVTAEQAQEASASADAAVFAGATPWLMGVGVAIACVLVYFGWRKGK